MKHCRWCNQDKPLAEFYVHRMMADGRLNKCKACVKAYAKERRLTCDRPREIDNRRYREGSKKAYLVQHTRTHPKPPLVSSAQAKVARAIQVGKLTRPTRCESCGTSPIFTEAAHHDYAEPLAVTWLCRRCHRRWDAADPKGGRPMAASAS